MKNIFFIALLCLNESLVAGDVLPLSEGLTLAQIQKKETQVLVVLRDQLEQIDAINISQLTSVNGSIIEVYNKLGAKKIIELVNQYSKGEVTRYHYSELLSPAGKGKHHIALGLNYKKHADEVRTEDEPFLFLKTISATRDQDLITSKETLLDYEVELCARPLQVITQPNKLTEEKFAYFLCGDFTDRAALLLQMDVDNVQSGKGFSSAKSVSGYFPTGPFLVIPNNAEKFLKNIALSLYRNERLVQHANVLEMTWDIQQAIKQLFEHHLQKKPTHAKASQWLPDGKLTSDITLLTGTPSGVIMRPPSFWFKFTGGIKYFLGYQKSIHKNVKDAVIAQYVQYLLEEKSFLQPGENIVLRANYLGSISFQVRDSQ